MKTKNQKTGKKNKLHCKSAQINMGFVVSMLLLSVLIITTTVVVINWMPSIKENSQQETLRSMAVDLNKMLLEDPGSPADWWSISQVERIGLAEYDTNLNEIILGKLDLTKITETEDAGYRFTQGKLELNNDTAFRLQIENGSINLMDQHDLLPAGGTRVVVVKRTMVVGDDIVNVTLWVW